MNIVSARALVDSRRRDDERPPPSLPCAVEEWVSWLTFEALVAGADDVQSRRRGSWWLLWSTFDWLAVERGPRAVAARDLSLGGARRAHEHLLDGHCVCVLAAWDGRCDLILGRERDTAPMRERLTRDFASGRVLAFRPRDHSGARVRRQLGAR